MSPLSHEAHPMSTLRNAYESRLHAGALRLDPAQAQAVNLLADLADRLNAPRKSFLSRIFKTPAPRGLYLYGDVGRGKSMLMDLLFDSVTGLRKRRTHFHPFMLEVHDRLHKYRKEGDSIPRLARELAQESRLLCFDEFHVSNIADAMILGRLFTALFEAGVTVVATSNWPPDDLYKGGLQRDRFLPFIDILKQRLNVHHLAGALDYRHTFRQERAHYFTFAEPEAAQKLQNIFDELTDGASPASLTLPVQGRAVPIPRTAKGVAFFDFKDLCERPLGAADYLAIAECFPVVLIANVPRFTPAMRNEAARFTTLIDALYEAKSQLFMTAESPPADLCPAGDSAFAFHRTASRLAEMQGEEYRQRAHLS